MSVHQTYRHFRSPTCLRFVLAGAFCFITAKSARTQDAPATVPPESKSKVPSEAAEGLWPSGKLLDIMLTRWAEESCAEFDLDKEQNDKVRDSMVRQWRDYLTEQRSTIQPLLNEFIEMRLDVNPPNKDRVKAWAEKAMPVFEKTRQQINKSHDAFREVMRPSQRLKFEADVLKMGIGLQLAEEKLKSWKQGDFDRDDIWEGRPADREHRREIRRRRDAERENAQELQSRAESDQITTELTAWEKYVAEFAARFSFDESQRNAAQSFLSELKARARDHRDRHRDEIAAMEFDILHNKGGETEAADIKEKLRTLYGPIDDLFKELKDRLDELPTSTQRAAVEESERSELHRANAPAQVDSPRSSAGPAPSKPSLSP